MGKHDWMTRSNSRSRYARRISDSRDPGPERPAGAGPSDIDTGPPGHSIRAAAPRIRWRIGSGAAWVAAGLAASLVVSLWTAGAFGDPDRNVTEIDARPTVAAPESEVPETGPDTEASAPPSQPGLSPAGVRIPANNKPPPDRIVVHVAGAVIEPGIVRLKQGSRIHQAIEAAGGATDKAELHAVNLAARIEDGQQLYLPTQAEAAAAPGPLVAGAGPPGPVGSGHGSAGLPGENEVPKISLNTASAEELSTLPGVGPVLSGRIVQWREKHGMFNTVDELDAVSGIGEKMLATLRGLVTL